MTFTAVDSLFHDSTFGWKLFLDNYETDTLFPNNPGVVVNAARLAAIDYTSAPWEDGYDRIVTGSSNSTTSVAVIRPFGQRFASLTYIPVDQGTRILGGSEVPSGAPVDGYHVCARDDGIACAVQTYLWDATGNTTYRTNALAILDCYKDVVAFGPGDLQPPSSNTSYKPLIPGIGMEGFVAALSVLGSFPNRATIAANFAQYWWPALWHGTGGNWLATFALGRLGIALAAEDRDLWDVSVAYYDKVIKANIWLTSDGPTVNELPRRETLSGGYWVPGVAAPAGSDYSGHWWSQVPSNRSSALLTHGQNCEFTRDDGHMMMGLKGLLYGALTIEHQGGNGLDTYGDRIIASYELAAGSVLNKLDTAVTPSGGAGWQQGWLPAVATFGAEVPNCAELITRSAELGNPFSANAQIMQGMLFADGI